MLKKKKNVLIKEEYDGRNPHLIDLIWWVIETEDIDWTLSEFWFFSGPWPL